MIVEKLVSGQLTILFSVHSQGLRVAIVLTLSTVPLKRAGQGCGSTIRAAPGTRPQRYYKMAVIIWIYLFLGQYATSVTDYSNHAPPRV